MNYQERIETDKFLSKFAIGVYEENREQLPLDWKCLLHSYWKNGFDAEAYINGDKIAIRGTEITSGKDLMSDIQKVENINPNIPVKQYMEKA